MHDREQDRPISRANCRILDHGDMLPNDFHTKNSRGVRYEENIDGSVVHSFYFSNYTFRLYRPGRRRRWAIS